MVKKNFMKLIYLILRVFLAWIFKNFLALCNAVCNIWKKCNHSHTHIRFLLHWFFFEHIIKSAFKKHFLLPLLYILLKKDILLLLLKKFVINFCRLLKYRIYILVFICVKWWVKGQGQGDYVKSERIFKKNLWLKN